MQSDLKSQSPNGVKSCSSCVRVCIIKMEKNAFRQKNSAMDCTGDWVPSKKMHCQFSTGPSPHLQVYLVYGASTHLFKHQSVLSGWCTQYADNLHFLGTFDFFLVPNLGWVNLGTQIKFQIYLGMKINLWQPHQHKSARYQAPFTVSCITHGRIYILLQHSINLAWFHTPDTKIC